MAVESGVTLINFLPFCSAATQWDYFPENRLITNVHQTTYVQLNLNVTKYTTVTTRKLGWYGYLQDTVEGSSIRGRQRK